MVMLLGSNAHTNLQATVQDTPQQPAPTPPTTPWWLLPTPHPPGLPHTRIPHDSTGRLGLPVAPQPVVLQSNTTASVGFVMPPTTCHQHQPSLAGVIIVYAPCMYCMKQSSLHEIDTERGSKGDHLILHRDHTTNQPSKLTQPATGQGG